MIEWSLGVQQVVYPNFSNRLESAFHTIVASSCESVLFTSDAKKWAQDLLCLRGFFRGSISTRFLFAAIASNWGQSMASAASGTCCTYFSRHRRRSERRRSWRTQQLAILLGVKACKSCSMMSSLHRLGCDFEDAPR